MEKTEWKYGCLYKYTVELTGSKDIICIGREIALLDRTGYMEKNVQNRNLCMEGFQENGPLSLFPQCPLSPLQKKIYWMYNCYCYCTFASLPQNTAIVEMPSRIKHLHFVGYLRDDVSAFCVHQFYLRKVVDKQWSCERELSISTEISQAYQKLCPFECMVSYKDCISPSLGFLSPPDLPLLICYSCISSAPTLS